MDHMGFISKCAMYRKTIFSPHTDSHFSSIYWNLAFLRSIWVSVVTVVNSSPGPCHYHIASLTVAFCCPYRCTGWSPPPPLLLFVLQNFFFLSFHLGSGCYIWWKILLVHSRLQKSLVWCLELNPESFISTRC